MNPSPAPPGIPADAARERQADAAITCPECAEGIPHDPRVHDEPGACAGPGPGS
ncbi:hypothetical protein HNP84_003317 [Thermocatellispora tengchongensis]|uniref:Uncharacterized protein n=1 Tax=Thermocatellispora tengchongensis TaxID=1073253 RepID=A0A840P6V3_9ACTN|nr:hypothetical protein [Thermocatellispora tengchongensis]MBB5133591.1 hypothetical protein [Thermocatellispora tengchongensis]